MESPRTERDVFHTQFPDPATKRPYGYLQLVSEPDAPIPGETEASFAVHWFGDAVSVDEFGEAMAPLDHHHTGEFSDIRGLRFSRESRTLTPEPDLPEVYHLTDVMSVRYLSLARLGEGWPVGP